VTDHSTGIATAPSNPSSTPGTASTPEFDRQEIHAFGEADGHAVAVIGKMLVGFFFYSLLVMSVVAAITFWGIGQYRPEAPHASHATDADDF
jgi:hypothetical protein